MAGSRHRAAVQFGHQRPNAWIGATATVQAATIVTRVTAVTVLAPSEQLAVTSVTLSGKCREVAILHAVAIRRAPESALIPAPEPAIRWQRFGAVHFDDQSSVQLGDSRQLALERVDIKRYHIAWIDAALAAVKKPHGWLPR